MGAAWVYTRSGGVWSQQGLKLVGTGAVGAAQQGVSVAVSADGGTAVVGGPADSSAGAAWVYAAADVVETLVVRFEAVAIDGAIVVRWELADGTPFTRVTPERAAQETGPWTP